MSANDFRADVLDATARMLEAMPLRVVVTCPVCQATAWRPSRVHAIPSNGGDSTIEVTPSGFKPFTQGEVCEHPVTDLTVVLDTIPEVEE